MIAILRFGEEHQDLRADESAKQHPQAQVVDSFARQSIARGEPRCDQDGAEKCDSEKDAVSVDGETADTNNFRVHNSCSLIFVLCSLYSVSVNQEQRPKI